MNWREAPYVALDFESTGMNPAHDEVIQAGLIALQGDHIHLGSAWATWVRPARPFQNDAITIHGLSFERLQDAPAMTELRPALSERLQDRVLIAHYADLELGFLKRWHIKPRQVVDTLLLALALDGQTTQTARRDAYTLTALARRFGLTVYGEHDALADAMLTAQVFLVLASELEQKGRVKTVKDLERLSGRGGWRLFG